MRVTGKLFLIACGGILVAGCLMYSVGVLSRPRDYSSPAIRIELVDQLGSPMSGIEVGRSWYDSDCAAEGHDNVKTDAAGAAYFAKVPAKVGLFTGALRKALTSLGSCGSGNGTGTSVYVRYDGQCDVAPRNKTLHRTGQTYEDQGGVTFYTATDSLSNTLVNLSLPGKIRDIHYVLSSSAHVR